MAIGFLLYICCNDLRKLKAKYPIINRLTDYKGLYY